MRWQPAITDGLALTRLPAVGALIATTRTRKPVRVVMVDIVDSADWTDEERDAWQRAGMPDPWDRRPVRVRVAPVDGSAEFGYRVQPWHWASWWAPLPEHYAVCSACGELAPCQHLTAEWAAVAAVTAQDKQDVRLLPGCCPGCGEPITSRQHSVTFAGPNLLSPLAHDDPTFHLRRRCVTSAAHYEERWVAADPARPRSLLTLSCQGTVVVHHDGSRECFGAVGSDCPDGRAGHRGYVACYAQTHGCPKDCPREGHPGC